MFSFFKKKFGSAPAPAPTAAPVPAPLPVQAAEPSPPEVIKELPLAVPSVPAPNPTPAAPVAAEAPASPSPAPVITPEPASAPAPVPMAAPALVPVVEPVVAATPPEPRRSWMDKLRQGLRKTGSSIAQVFTGTQIDDALFEELEEALLMADTGVKATEFLLEDLKRRVKEARATEPKAVRGLLVEALADLLRPLEKALTVGQHSPTVMMVVGVNGAGKTTSIGKLTRHLAEADQKVLLAAADTFRAAAREQLAVWADRTQVQIISQEGGDPSAVTFDAVSAGRARGCDVVLADTAGRLPTQLHLMEELKKIKRVIGKAQEGAPHEVLLVVDGNTGQNALSQVKSFDDALGLTGLIVTKLDGTAKGGVLAAIARERAIPVYFIGVGEKLEDLQTFNAREFAQALLE
ncbi:signal recognition particle-docking protein FtsY [Paucibacter sp. Y2R2-4]|uniref:signal recognition particle-docking protein FtsY n=1 Tax=Paucibacter sp. Y2R2-4 TaxID=2893553 RepID=UPI0021E35E86|nr:signal recognition particle-docking protein FtsY [Paucibacter sp. Y2R2-4]MCV2349851.1 signal recognition particle-docking protein FtsY [Paucibacter sp. Y2R2-4]